MVSIVFSYLRSEPINFIGKRLRRLTIAKGAWISSDIEEVEQNCDRLKEHEHNFIININQKSMNVTSTPEDTWADDSNTSADVGHEHIRNTCQEEPRTPPSSECKYHNFSTPQTVEFLEEEDDFSVSTLGSVVSDSNRSKVSNSSPIAVGSF